MKQVPYPYSSFVSYLLEWMVDNTSQIQHGRVRLFGVSDEPLGEAFCVPGLVQVLWDGDTVYDLFSEAAGGSVPVHLDEVTRIEVYIG
jgi:hypothetical protein